MASEYTIKSVKKGSTWSNSYGEYQSYALAVAGVGEPVKMDKTIPVAVEPVEGDTIYGNLSQDKAANGRIYYKFKSEMRPAISGNRDDIQASIQSQFSIRLAVEVWIAQGCNSEAYGNIEKEASHFYAMIHKVKGE